MVNARIVSLKFVKLVNTSLVVLVNIARIVNITSKRSAKSVLGHLKIKNIKYVLIAISFARYVM